MLSAKRPASGGNVAPSTQSAIRQARG
uniref:Uncharacterized protein n=1 Tax=Arundo donax TaxID=35708 RepID=A0A0A9BUS8_ARUDO